MHQIQFGTINNLPIVEGQPQLSKDNKAQKRRRMKNRTVGELLADDFALMEEQLQLFETFDEIKNGLIPTIVVARGLPQEVISEESLC
jgi:hypothetical protein